MRRLNTMLWALPLSLALTGDRDGGHPVHARDGRRAAREVHAEGEHRVRASLGAAGGELRLKSGFSLRPRLSRERSLPLSLELRIAQTRAMSAEVAMGFVPIGPTVELDRALARSDVSFLAESFRVRRGHRLVLAVERAGPCADRVVEPCWELWPAEYRDGRCSASGVAIAGRRMQFGSIPQATNEAAHNALP